MPQHVVVVAAILRPSCLSCFTPSHLANVSVHVLQVIIVAISRKEADRAEIGAAVDKLCAALKAAGIRAKVGDCSCKAHHSPLFY